MKSTWAMWGWPIVLAVLTAAGLVGALMGNGRLDWVGWVGLGLPTMVAIWFGWRGRS